MFQNNERWMGFYDSPNHFAVFCAMTLLIVTGFFVLGYSKKRFGIAPIISLSVYMVIVGYLLIALVKTYSRGGWLAFLCGIIFFGISSRLSRKWAILLTLIFCFFILLIPGAVHRSDSGVINRDLSVIHRIEVWKGAVMLGTEFPLDGVGSGGFRNEFLLRYQPEWIKEKYLGAVSDPLTIWAEKGVILFAGYIMLTLIPFGLYCVLFPKRQINPALAAILSAQVTWFVGGLFTKSFGYFWAEIFYYLSWCVSTVWLLILLKNEPLIRQYKIRRIASVFGIISLLVITQCSILYILGGKLRQNFVVITEYKTIDDVAYVIFRPQNTVPKALVVFYPEKGSDMAEKARDLYRPLAEKGFLVIPIIYGENQFQAFESAVKQLRLLLNEKQFSPFQFIIAGNGTGGRMALIASSVVKSERMKGAYVIDTQTQWPFKELSPLSFVQDFKEQLIMVYTRGNTIQPDERNKFIKTLNIKGISASVEYLAESNIRAKKMADDLDKIIQFGGND